MKNGFRRILRLPSAFWFCLLLSLSNCGPSGPGGLKPVAAPDGETGCPGRRATWKLEVLDRRAERRETEKVTALVADSIRRSFPGCAWAGSGGDGPTITVELNTFSSTYSYEGDGMWDARASWTVSAREAGRVLTEFECDAKASQPNYRNTNNEKDVLTRVFEEALRRALAGIRTIPAS
jgi:hypothetical protein